MRVAHIVPPPWTGLFPLGGYRMALAHWVTEYPNYVKQMRKPEATIGGALPPYILLDNGAFEHIQADNAQLALAASTIDASEVVLPDVLGDSAATLKASWDALKSMPTARVMFAAQGKSVGEWKNCLERWIVQFETSKYARVKRLSIGVTSLRTEDGTRSQCGLRKELMVLAHKVGYPIHLLGIPSLKEFAEYELPLAMKLGVRGVDSSIAFALAAAEELLIPISEKIPLRSPDSYESLSTRGRRLALLNTHILDDWVRSGKVLPGISVRTIRFTAQRWLQFYGEGFATVQEVMEACKFPRGQYGLRTAEDDEEPFEPFVFPIRKGSPSPRKGDKLIEIGE